MGVGLRGGFRGGFRGGCWVAGWVSVGCGVSFGGWLAVGLFLVDSGGFGWLFFVDLFYVAPNTQCRIFYGAFS